MNGEAYVPVRALRADGANGNGSEGAATSGSYWIHWNGSGFTGQGWSYIGDELQYTGFPAIAAQYGYDMNVKGLEDYMNSPNFPGNLDAVLGDENWDTGSKTAFVYANVSVLGIWGNIEEGERWYEYYRADGCIQAM